MNSSHLQIVFRDEKDRGNPGQKRRSAGPKKPLEMRLKYLLVYIIYIIRSVIWVKKAILFR